MGLVVAACDDQDVLHSVHNAMFKVGDEQIVQMKGFWQQLSAKPIAHMLVHRLFHHKLCGEP